MQAFMSEGGQVTAIGFTSVSWMNDGLKPAFEYFESDGITVDFVARRDDINIQWHERVLTVEVVEKEIEDCYMLEEFDFLFIRTADRVWYLCDGVITDRYIEIGQRVQFQNKFFVVESIKPYWELSALTYELAPVHGTSLRHNISVHGSDAFLIADDTQSE
jgi:hypothetical protein